MTRLSTISFSNENSVDREDEIKFIIDEIDNKTSDVLIISAISGIGKSTLTNKVTNIINNNLSFCIRTNPENNAAKETEGLYLSQIFNELVKVFQKRKTEFRTYTFEYFLSHNKSAIIKRSALESMFASITPTPKKFFTSTGVSVTKYFLSRIFKLYEYNPANKLNLNDRDSMLIASNYIQYILSKGNICLVVDNLQNIDDYSLELLIDWLVEYKKSNYFIFEYTLQDDKDTTPLLEIIKKWQNYNLNMKLLELPPMDPDNAIIALKKAYPSAPLNGEFFHEAQKYYLCESNGSIQKLFDYSLQYGKKSILDASYDPTLAKIDAIDNNTGKYILSIIIMHSGQISKSKLTTILNKSINPIVFEQDKIIADLIAKYEILLETETDYKLNHASIIDAWNSNKIRFEKYNLLAYRNCVNYYNSVLKQNHNENVSKSDALMFLLRVYAQYAPENFPTILDEITGLVSEKIKPENIWQYYLIFLDYIKGNEENFSSILYNMASFCFDHNLYKHCLYILQLLNFDGIHNEPDHIAVLKINCIEYLELHDEAISICLTKLDNCENDRQKYIYNLLLMGCYRSLNKEQEYMECVWQIKNIENYESFLEYGIFLRLSEIYMKRKDAIPYLKQSVMFFKEHKLILQEIKSRITYSFLLAVTDNLEEGIKELNYCEKLLKPYYCWQNVIDLNKASMLLLQSNFGEEVEFLLKKAELATNSHFDLLLIMTMQLVNKIECKQFDSVPYLINKITTLLEHESDKHLIALVSYDLYQVFIILEDEEKAIFYKNLAESVKAYNQNVQHHLNKTVDFTTKTLSNCKWSIGFTFFWNVDYIEVP